MKIVYMDFKDLTGLDLKNYNDFEDHIWEGKHYSLFNRFTKSIRNLPRNSFEGDFHEVYEYDTLQGINNYLKFLTDMIKIHDL